MPNKKYKEFEEVLQGVKYLPCVSIIFPFEPKMNAKDELTYKLKILSGKVEGELLKNYPEEKAMPVILKIRELVKNLNYTTHKKSIAIFVSPVVEKIYYLDIPVEEKIIIDDSFEIRDLIYSKKEIHKYLVLVLSKKAAHTYLGNSKSFIKLVINTPDHVAAYVNEIPGKVANFTDEHERHHIVLEKFLRHIDTGLGLLLNAYPLPVLIMGDVTVAGLFKKITHNGEKIIQYIHGNYEELTETELKEKLEPYITDWKHVKETELLQRLDAARSAGKLAIGIDKVWTEADHKKGHLLVVEKNYMYQARKTGEEGTITAANQPANAFFIKDAVDDVIEKVLANGGDVEFVGNGILDNFEHIALIQYY
ncbi:hypothetical protein [Flavihumibacter fluvii]|uniref:baeRF3 domain-containing protein n=1 Tax=Flavihumibacter fluvii TaxID=2838157 RepID=UPI001BDDFB0F|nr:hypothetical protein [Flavihumibacter fluvii]ULQ53313.1 hypothetical protein KJS93_03155 [Flavihumibacter fluvii]